MSPFTLARTSPLILLLASIPTLHAQTEITLIAPGGIRAAIAQLIPEFERQTHYKVKPAFGSGLGTKQQVARGDAFDVPIIQPPYSDVLASGNVIASSAKDLAAVAVGVAVRKGAPKPDISTPGAVQRMLLSAKSVAYPNPATGAAAGVSFDLTLKNLSILGQMQSRLKRAQGGAGAMTLVANGEAEIGITFLSEMDEPGIEIVGPLPEEISTPTTLVGFVSSHATNRAAAQALLDFLASPASRQAYLAHKMQPAN